MGFTQPVRAGDDNAASLRVHLRREIDQFRELWSHWKVGNIADGVEDRECGTSIVHNLMCKVSWEFTIILPRDSFAVGRDPFE